MYIYTITFVMKNIFSMFIKFKYSINGHPIYTFCNYLLNTSLFNNLTK